MTTTARPVAVVEDDESVRNGIRRLLRSTGRIVVTYASAEEFLARDPLDDPCCLVIDIHMSGMSGVDLVNRLVRDEVAIPVVFITASDEVGRGGDLSQERRVTCLQKPFDETALIQAIDAAIAEPGASRN